MEKYCAIGKNQLRHNVWIPILVCVAMLLLSPLVLGIQNLDLVQSAKVLETYVALIGIILFTPVFLPEQNKDLRDLITSKYTKISNIYIIRIFLSLAAALLLVLTYMAVMRTGGCEMEFGKYFFGTMAEILAFGGLAVFAYGLSDNLIIGYMASLVYYAAAIGMGAEYLKKFYPFAMVSDFQTKYWILAAGIILMAAGVFIRSKRS